MPYLLGYDIGSSSIKAALLNAETGELVASTSMPKTELAISAPKPGWAEQEPRTWWKYLKLATAKLNSKAPSQMKDILAIGISYQMHGLVIVDKKQRVLRPSIIWCDSRAVEIGERADREIGHEKCLELFLNSPGNFTASKLKWVMENEPEIFRKVYKAMLPGDYIAMMLTGEIKTTPSGLSEGIFWDFKKSEISDLIMQYFGFDRNILSDIAPTFSVQGELTSQAAKDLGLHEGIKVAYRAGDQPNNALSLNVLNPGEIATTAGTSGVVYGVSDKPVYDKESRVNTFIHVNHSMESPRYGILSCINGTGILNRWVKHNLFGAFKRGIDYEEMNEIASHAPAGCDGLFILPYGNGAERTLDNRDIGASIHGLNFNIHKKEHFLRAVQEGIVFALNYGVEIMREMGIDMNSMKAGHANMFLSPLFASIFASTTGTTVGLYETDGAQGAARGAGIGVGYYKNHHDAFMGLRSIKTIEPNPHDAQIYKEYYKKWRTKIGIVLK